MKNMIIICAACIFLLLTAPAKAGTITQDFDGITTTEGYHLTAISGPPGPTLTFTNAIIAKFGNPPYAYQASHGYGTDGAHSGSYSITDVIAENGTFYKPSSPISVSFATPVDDLSFYAMDIDGYEVLTAKVYNGATLLETITIDTINSGTGDGSAKLVEFTAGNISSLTVTVYDGIGSGWALDDLSYAPVPIPGAVWLLGSGLFGLVAVRRKRNNIS